MNSKTVNRRKEKRFKVNQLNFSGGCALVLIDSRQLRSLEQKRCQQLYDKLITNQQTLDIHEQISAPKFKEWMLNCFSNDIEAVIETSQRVVECRGIVEAVESQSVRLGISPAKAYQKLMKLKSVAEHSNSETPESSALEEELIRNSFESMYGTKEQWGSPHQTYEEAFAEFKRDSTIQDEDAHLGGDEDFGVLQHHSPKALCRLKELYRTLAKELHPDLNQELAVEKIELWYRVQNAYEDQDIILLETLYSVHLMKNQDVCEITDSLILTQLVSALTCSLKDLEKKLKSAKKEKSWKFNEKLEDAKKLKNLENKIGNEIQSNHYELSLELEELQYYIDKWAKAAKRSPRSGKSSASPP